MNLSFLRSKKFWICVAIALVVVVLIGVLFGKTIAAIFAGILSIFSQASAGKKIVEADQKRIEEQIKTSDDAEQKKTRLTLGLQQSEDAQKTVLRSKMNGIDRATQTEAPDQLRKRVLRETKEE